MNIYVGNLSWQMTDEDLRTLFEQYGSVTSAKIVKDKVSGRSKGFGFVEMPDDTEAQNALSSLYDSEVLGRKIIVNEAQPKPQKVAAAVAALRKEASAAAAETAAAVAAATRKVASTEAAAVADTTGIIKIYYISLWLKILSFGRIFLCPATPDFGEKGPPTQATSISSSSGS